MKVEEGAAVYLETVAPLDGIDPDGSEDGDDLPEGLADGLKAADVLDCRTLR